MAMLVITRWYVNFPWLDYIMLQMNSKFKWPNWLMGPIWWPPNPPRDFQPATLVGVQDVFWAFRPPKLWFDGSHFVSLALLEISTYSVEISGDDFPWISRSFPDPIIWIDKIRILPQYRPLPSLFQLLWWLTQRSNDRWKPWQKVIGDSDSLLGCASQLGNDS